MVKQAFQSQTGFDPDRHAQGLLDKLEHDPSSVWQKHLDDDFSMLNPEFALKFLQDQAALTPTQYKFLMAMHRLCPDYSMSPQDCCVEQTEAILYHSIYGAKVPKHMLARRAWQSTNFNQDGLEQCYHQPQQLAYRIIHNSQTFLKPNHKPTQYPTLSQLYSINERLELEKIRGILSPYLNIGVASLLHVVEDPGVDIYSKIDDERVTARILAETRKFYDEDVPHLVYDGVKFTFIDTNSLLAEGPEPGQSQYIHRYTHHMHVGHMIPLARFFQGDDIVFDTLDSSLEFYAEDFHQSQKSNMLLSHNHVAVLQGEIDGRGLKLEGPEFMHQGVLRRWQAIEERYSHLPQTQRVAKLFGIDACQEGIVTEAHYNRKVNEFRKEGTHWVISLEVGSFTADCIKNGDSYFSYAKKHEKYRDEMMAIIGRLHPALWPSGSCDAHRTILGWDDWQSPENRSTTRPRDVYAQHARRMQILAVHRKALADPAKPLGFEALCERIVETIKPQYRVVANANNEPFDKERFHKALRAGVNFSRAEKIGATPHSNIRGVTYPFSFFDPYNQRTVYHDSGPFYDNSMAALPSPKAEP